MMEATQCLSGIFNAAVVGVPPTHRSMAVRSARREGTLPRAGGVGPRSHALAAWAPAAPIEKARVCCSAAGVRVAALSGVERAVDSRRSLPAAPALRSRQPRSTRPVAPSPRANPSAPERLADPPRARPLRVAYQGMAGAYSEMAALKASADCEPYPCQAFESAFAALSQWQADLAVLPVENSLGGSIHAVFDLLTRYRLFIVGEVTLAVDHCLLALPGVRREDVQRVLSHPQALAQVEGYVRRMGAARQEVDDTAGAAQAVAANGWRDAAAVASSRAAELYGLDILDRHIQDAPDNVTRFVVLSRDPVLPRGVLLGKVGGGEGLPVDRGQARGEEALEQAPQQESRGVLRASGGAADAGISSDYKTSIVFSLEQVSGALFQALSVFALRNIDLTKIESRPMRDNPLVETASESGHRTFNYLFYVDFIGSSADVKVQNALRHLQETSPFLRILGSYRRDVNL